MTRPRAFALISRFAASNFRGNVEGHDLFGRRRPDVVVCDGFFWGNVVLKDEAESRGRGPSGIGFKAGAGRRNPVRLLGALFLRGALQRAMKQRMDPEFLRRRRRFLGVKGTCIITHGPLPPPRRIFNAIRGRVGNRSVHQLKPHDRGRN